MQWGPRLPAFHPTSFIRRQPLNHCVSNHKHTELVDSFPDLLFTNIFFPKFPDSLEMPFWQNLAFQESMNQESELRSQENYQLMRTPKHKRTTLVQPHLAITTSWFFFASNVWQYCWSTSLTLVPRKCNIPNAEQITEMEIVSSCRQLVL